MIRKQVARPLAVAALLVTVALPASTQGAREQASLTDLLGLLQSDDATADELKTALARVEEILGFQPPPCEAGQDRMFNDVPASNPFCPFIEEMARRGITSGCGNNNFCPGNPVTRAQMATFIVKTLGEPAWHEIGAPGEPAFGDPDASRCAWGNFDAVNSSAGFTLDGAGFLHLKGVVQVDDVSGSNGCEVAINSGSPGSDAVANRTIFVIPPGFCPGGNRHYVFPVLTNGELGRITISATEVDPPCGVVVDAPTTFENADQWVSLDGISVRGGN